MYKELSKLDNKKTNNKEWTKALNRHFTKKTHRGQIREIVHCHLVGKCRLKPRYSITHLSEWLK